MKSLTASDFAEFFQSLYGYPPFPWQQRIVDRLSAAGGWPEVFALPTGSGKTALIDVAIFHLAMEAAAGPHRRAPMRVAFVVDRRIIVDAAYNRSRDMVEKLKFSLMNDPESVVGRVARALQSLAGDGAPPVVVSRLHGGAPREGDWTTHPGQPTVVCSTVDQVGSRLLFRGYGVSPAMRPIHAGLLGDDALLFLDEVHLSEPFRQTLGWVRHHRKAERAPWQTVELSATPRTNNADVFRMENDDRQNETLKKRLFATKSAELHLTKTEGRQYAAFFAERAVALFDDGLANGLRNTLVVVNRVALAREVYTLIEAAVGRRLSAVDVRLLIGLAREVEKGKLREEILERCESRPNNRVATTQSGPFILVATQTVEAGADLDFDILVTQLAPLDALRQRFGRLNRMGRDIDPRAEIIARADDVAKNAKEDVIYGNAPSATWSWLTCAAERASKTSLGNVDFGIVAMDHMLESVSQEDTLCMRSPVLDAPTLVRGYLDYWATTRPAPETDPEPALFLHGERSSGDVQIIWRADIPVSDPRHTSPGEIMEIIATVPPRPSEALALPIGTVRSWMRGLQDNADVVDLEVGVLPGADAEHPVSVSRRFSAWRWNGIGQSRAGDAEGIEVIRASDLRPGDILIVPSKQGGCDEYGWNLATRSTTDVAREAARPYATRQFAIRFHPAIVAQYLESDLREAERDSIDIRALQNLTRTAHELVAMARTKVEDNDSIERIVRDIETIGGLPKAYVDDLRLLRKPLSAGAEGVLVTYPYQRALDEAQETADESIDDSCFVIEAMHGIASEFSTPDIGSVGESSTEDDDRGSESGTPLSLAIHSRDVETFARRFATAAGLDDALSNDVALAAWLHDGGKADERFQRYLHGSKFASWGDRPLAKSGRTRGPRGERRARELARLPEAWRHEALSVRLALTAPRFQDANDPELVLWLIGTHHGWGRPFFPHADALDEQLREIDNVITPGATVTLAPGAGPQSLDFRFTVTGSTGPREIDWPTMFARLHRRYGFWGLARIESILRLADHRASAYRAVQRGAHV